MKLIRVRPIGMFSYGNVNWIDLSDQGLVELVGLNRDRSDSSNGSGKTSLYSAITTLGWGRNNVKADADDVVNRVWNKGCLGSLEFISYDNKRCRITHARHWKQKTVNLGPYEELSEIVQSGGSYSGTVIFLEEWDSKEKIWRDCRAKSMPLTQARCVEWLGIDYDMFCSTSYIAQGSVLKFMVGTPDDREQVISDLLHLKIYSDAGSLAHTKATEIKKQVESVKNIVVENESFLSRITLLTNEQKQELENYINARLHDVEEIEKTLQKVNNEILDISKSLTNDELDEIRKEETVLSERLNKLVFNRSLLDQELKAFIQATELKKREITTKQDSELQQLKNQENVIHHEIKRLETNVSNLKSLQAICDVCGSEITPGHLEKEKQRREYLLSESFTRLEEIRNKQQERIVFLKNEEERIISELVKSITEKTEAINNRKNTIDGEANTITTNLNTVKEKQRILSQEKVKKASLFPTLQSQVSQYNNLKHQNLTAINQVKEQLNSNLKNEEIANGITTKVSNERENLSKLEDEQRYYQWWSKHMGELQIRKIGSAIAALNDNLRQLLEIATEGDIEAWISPYRVRAEAKKKKQEDLQPSDYIFEPELVIREGAKQTVPSRLYSGGEQGLVMLCLMLSFWSLSERGGQGSGLVIFDEIFGRWDEHNTTHVVSLLNYLRERIGTIIITTHHKSVKEIIDADKIWQVEKKDGISVLNVLKS